MNVATSQPFSLPFDLEFASAAAEPLASFKCQALHAYRLGLVNPLSGAAMQWEAPLPADMRALLDAIKV